MKYEDLYVYIGEMGVYQWRVFAAIFFFSVFSADSMHMVFVGGDMDHWCRVPELQDLPDAVQKNVAIPSTTAEDGSTEHSSCEMFAFDYSSYSESEFESWNRSVMLANSTDVVKCSQWVYDQSTFISTIVSRVSKF
jgi:hypothetical protein